MKQIILLLFIFFFFAGHAGKERLFVDATKPINEKEAILILPGFGSRIQGTKFIADFFFNKGYDVYIPDYIARKSINNCVANLDKFIAKYKLKDYKKVHVFSYIVGSWTLNNWIMKNPVNNISSIVYDRSPLQERAPYALVNDIPLIIRMVAGKIMKEFSKTPYPTLRVENVNTGIIIESKATDLLKKHKKSALSLGPVSWDVAALNQTNNDFFYTWLSHDDMYTRFDVSGSEILYFFRNGKFTNEAKRVPYTEDPFIPYNEKK